MTVPAFVDGYRSLFENTWTDSAPVDEVRFVVLDSETTGLDPRKDRLITIGAVAVQGGEIVLEDAYESMLQVAYNTSSVTIHGVTRDEASGGLTEPEALEQFLDYVKDGVIVGHHIMHDVETFNAGYERHFGFRLLNRSLDTMDLTLHLEKDGAFAGREQIRSFTLDALCALFGVVPHDRHTAPGDAFLTAQVFQRLLRLAKRFGRTTLGGLAELFPVDAGH
ncbi:MAG: 3'-5' exonuclease [Acidobacteria bacterium]|nr:3'-5' exonuclease [Acidobacteriota bacterium]